MKKELAPKMFMFHHIKSVFPLTFYVLTYPQNVHVLSY